MEVSGRGAYTRSETEQGSDDVINGRHCLQCHANGWFEVAAAYGTNCNDYLCTDCVRQHRSLERFKDHIILEGADGGHNANEVSGRWACMRSEVQQGFDYANNVLRCEDCHDNGWFEVASAFCSNCNYYLCTDCVRKHRRMRRLKNHIILEGAAMPKEKPRDDGGDECLEHRGKFIELFCHSDNTLACILCIAEGHRACANVTSISKLSSGMAQSRELKDVKLSARKQNNLLSSYIKGINEYRVLNDDCYHKYVEEFETFKGKIEAALGLLANRVYSEAGKLEERNEKKLDSLLESVSSLKQKLESQISDMETKEAMRKMDQLFIAVKKNKKDIDTNRQKFNEMLKDIHIETYIFVADPKIQPILDKMVSTNPTRILPGGVKCTAETGVKTTECEKDCSISDLVLISPTEILVADNENDCLKHIDFDKKIFIAGRRLSSHPRDVTVMPGSRVAVTVPDKHEIQYFDTQKRLAPCGSIRVDGRCLGIQSTDDTLIVSFQDPSKVAMMDFKGLVMRSFTTDSRGVPLFDSPGSLSLSPDHANIYVSDYDNGVVTCLSTGGRVNWKYKGTYISAKALRVRYDEGCSQMGMDTGTDGCLYICSYKTNSIYVVSPAGIKLRVIPLTKYGIRYPKAVCYNKMNASLYVSSSRRDTGLRNSIRQLSFQ